MCFLQAVVRAVCAIIDAFHFSTPPEGEASSAAEPQQVEEAAEENGTDDEDEAEAGPQAEAAEQEEILRSLTKRVLPALEAALVSHH